jgi:hypothetical protein
MYEVQTVEVRFRGEKLATETIEDAGVYTLYRTPLNDYYVHHVDEDRGFSWLVTHRNREPSTGKLLEGLEDWQVRALWPELASAAGLDQHDPSRYAAEEDWRAEHEMKD